MEFVDEAVGRVAAAAEKLGYALLITADHGNCDQMFDRAKDGSLSVRTAHSLNPVPFIACFLDPARTLKDGKFGLSSVASTVAELLGLTPPKAWDASLLA